MMAAGKSDREIFQHMVDRYGDYVLYKPPLVAHLAPLGRADPVAGRRRGDRCVRDRSQVAPAGHGSADPGLGAS